MDSTRRLWTALAVVIIGSFAALLWIGLDVYQKAPPMPERVLSSTGEVIYTRADIERGRQVWRSIGGMQLGSIWGHGGYVAPDWSADWLHREALAVLDGWAVREAKSRMVRASSSMPAREKRSAMIGASFASMRSRLLS